MHVFGIVLTLRRSSIRVCATIRHEIPAGFRLISKENIRTIVPPQPTPHALRKAPGLTFRVLVHPVRHWTFKAISMRRDQLWEFALKSREHIIERKSVSGQIHPTRVSSEDCKRLSRPKTIRFTPVRNIGIEFSHVVSQSLHVIFPERCSRSVQILLEDTRPLLASDTFLNGANSLRTVHVIEVKFGGELNIRFQFLVCLVVFVIKRTTFVLDDTRESIQV